MNTKIRSGEMSLDESTGLLGMTIKIPVNGNAAALDDQEQVNFMQPATDGMQGARSRNDQAQLRMLQTAKSIMQQYQGKPLVNVLA